MLPRALNGIAASVAAAALGFAGSRSFLWPFSSLGLGETSGAQSLASGMGSPTTPLYYPHLGSPWIKLL